MAVEKPLYNKIVGNLVRPWLEFFFFLNLRSVSESEIAIALIWDAIIRYFSNARSNITMSKDGHDHDSLRLKSLRFWFKTFCYSALLINSMGGEVISLKEKETISGAYRYLEKNSLTWLHPECGGEHFCNRE